MSDKPENAVQETESSEEITETTPMQGPQLLVGLAVGLSILGGSSGLAWYFWANQEEAQRRPQRAKIADVQAELGMDEGFDVGLEMSGNPNAFNDMLENMCHGGKIAMLGIPEKEMAIDWNKVVFNMLTIKGIYGREMYETWYKMTVMLEGGLDIAPVITHRFGFEKFEKAFETALSGESGKVILKW